MPIYEYYCPGCHQKFEKLRPMNTDTKQDECPTCHRVSRKAISVFAAPSKNVEYGAGIETRNSGGGCCGGGCACGNRNN